MEFLPALSNSPWVTYRQLVKTKDNPDGLIPKGTFDSWKHRGHARVSCVGGNNRQVYIEFDTLPKEAKKLVIEKYGDPRAYIASKPLEALLRVDDVARVWYSTYKLPNGTSLPLEYQLKYARSCDWLNLISVCLKDKKYLKERMGISVMQFWTNVLLLIRNDDQVHDLPGSEDRLRIMYKKYEQGSYLSLVDVHRWGNDFRRKVTPKISNLIVSLYCMPHKPYMAEVCKLYKEFIAGKLQVVDVNEESGGEVFDPKEFYVPKTKKKGGSTEMVPFGLGESTVDFYLKKPVNVAIINKTRMKKQDYDTAFRPSVKRIAPHYAFSKVTMDDIDLPFKGPDGDRVVKSYQVFDVASEAVVGVSFSKDKNMELIREALRDMFRLIIRKGWGVPWEIEMERHLTTAMMGGENEDGSRYDDILTPGAVFPATRICQSAQAKRAEGFIKKKKYGIQKKREGFQGRFYSRLLVNRLNTDQKQLRQQYEEIVEHELQDIATYNNELHPKQDLYPGMTRWDVLEQNQNPNLARYSAAQVIQFIGYGTATSIKAGVARVYYGDYALPDIELIKNTTYNGEITAYYLPDENGMVNEVHLFEDGQYLCECKRRMAFQEAVVEQTAEDVEIMQQQWGQQKRFDAMVKAGNEEIRQVGVIASTVPQKPRRAAKVIVAIEQKEVDALPTVATDIRRQALMDI